MAEGYKDWSAGEILTAADLEDYTVKQSVMRFADSSARTTALSGVLAEGMVSYLKDTDTVEVYDGSAWAAVAGGKILQIVSTAKTDTFSASVAPGAESAAAVAVTITPTSATSKVFLIANLALAGTSIAMGATLYRGGSVVAAATGDAASSRTRATSGMSAPGGERSGNNTSFTFLDSPATTSATTYDARVWHDSIYTSTVYMNRGHTDAEISATHRSISTLTAIEVSA